MICYLVSIEAEGVELSCYPIKICCIRVAECASMHWCLMVYTSPHSCICLACGDWSSNHKGKLPPESFYKHFEKVDSFGCSWQICSSTGPAVRCSICFYSTLKSIAELYCLISLVTLTTLLNLSPPHCTVRHISNSYSVNRLTYSTTYVFSSLMFQLL